ncbi:arabinan endo-1,5-alpha-L-arabinosidase [Metabacillus crassostreae]|uniref:arabinan endo-1,5-alpha-L-arabinosidase n=1 Tax=Metabacillus crassostreae TaxID=929098 RepID=UPI0019592B5E|nr:arabinan endo-1,5-alpha-L-arabinosidase [Metabacillus crassostreae]MBM7603838.1 arabinan endo-1,5-alpha-L-arabinosidase [Metabacillus crassostreae]
MRLESEGIQKMMFPKAPIKYDLYDQAIANDESLWTIHNVHDPALYKDGDTYYVFSTDAKVGGEPTGGIQVRKSKDLIHWEWVGHAFEEIPTEAHEWTGAKGLWAPDVTKYGDTYYLYYAASQFGKNQSFIGVATSNNIEGPWVDQGEVIKTKHGESIPNAIDPNITFDEEGNPWMVYGSFFGGIFVAKVDPSTGKLIEQNDGILISKRPHSVEAAVEGPYIVYHPEFKKYYLFVSYDSLFRDYNIRVARADKIEGPYVDFNGNDMTNIEISPNDTGLKILGGYKFGDAEGWIGPGHNSVLKDGNDYFVCHHARGEKTKKHHALHIRKIVWTNDGWPLVSPERYAGEKEQTINPSQLTGLWEVIEMDRNDNNQLVSKPMHLLSEGKIEHIHNGHWIYKDDNQFELGFEEKIFTLYALPAWDWSRWNSTLVFTGKDKEGNVLIGKKMKE